MQPFDGQPTPSPLDGVPPPTPPGGRWPASLVAAAGATAALVIAAVVVVVINAGGDDDPDEAATETTEPVETTSTTRSNAGSVASSTPPDDGGGGGGGVGDGAAIAAGLPPVTIPGQTSPPTTAPGEEPNSIPAGLGGEEVPQFGTIVVDLEEGGYQDFPVHLRSDQEITLLSLADDGISTFIEVFAPDGSSEGTWEGGEPGVVNGLEWYLPDEPLPATGTYVIRVIHTGNSHERFVLGFFGNA